MDLKYAKVEELSPDQWVERQTKHFIERGDDAATAREKAIKDHEIKNKINQELATHSLEYATLKNEYLTKWQGVKARHGGEFNPEFQAIETVRMIADARLRAREKHPEMPEWEIRELANEQLEEWANKEMSEIGDQGQQTAKQHFVNGKAKQPTSDGYKLHSEGFAHLRLAPVLDGANDPQIKGALSEFRDQYAVGMAEKLGRNTPDGKKHLEAAKAANTLYGISTRNPFDNSFLETVRGTTNTRTQSPELTRSL